MEQQPNEEERKQLTNEEKKLAVPIFYDIIIPYCSKRRDTPLSQENLHQLNIFYKEIHEDIMNYLKGGGKLEKLIPECDRAIETILQHQTSPKHAKILLNLYLKSIK